VNCASCGFANAAAARFCAGCGKPLEDAAAVPDVGERRQLTVLMCDLVGSTALSQALDSEDLRAMLTDYRRVCSEVVEREEDTSRSTSATGSSSTSGSPTRTRTTRGELSGAGWRS